MTKLELIFCCHQQKIQKMNHFWQVNGRESGSKQDITPFFSSTLWALFFGIFHFSISRPSKVYGRHPLLYLLVCKIRIYMLKMILSILLTYIKFAYLWYITSFVPNLISTWPQSHGLSCSALWGFWDSLASFLINLFISSFATLLTGHEFSAWKLLRDCLLNPLLVFGGSTVLIFDKFILPWFALIGGRSYAFY